MMRHNKLSCRVCKKVFTKHNLENIKNTILKDTVEFTQVINHLCALLVASKFTQKAHLKAHETTTSDERKYRCDICVEGRFFKTKGQLSTHLKLHFEP